MHECWDDKNKTKNSTEASINIVPFNVAKLMHVKNQAKKKNEKKNKYKNYECNHLLEQYIDRTQSSDDTFEKD